MCGSAGTTTPMSAPPWRAIDNTVANMQWTRESMEMSADAGRQFWRGLLHAGGFTPIPRWTLDPVPAVAELEATIPDDVVAALRGLAIPLDSVLLAAPAKVLAVLCGESQVVTGYVAGPAGRPLPCRLTTDHPTWRTMLLDMHRVVSELLAHQDFPVDDFKRETALTGPSFETVFDPTGTAGDFADDTVLWVGLRRHDGRLVLRLRYRTEVLDAGCAGRIAGYHLAALALMAADTDAE